MSAGQDLALLKSLADQSRWDEAGAVLARLEAVEDPEVAFQLARIEESAGRLQQARARLLALRTRLPRSTPFLEMQLGQLQQKLGDMDAAIECMRAAIALKPDFSAAYKNLAALLGARERIDEAKSVLERGVAAVPADASLWVRLCSVESHRGDSQAALAALAKAVHAMPVTSAAWREIGYAYTDYWRYDEADRALALAAALDPGEPQIETHRAFVKTELGDTQGALQVLQAAIGREPANLRAVVSERLMLPQVYTDSQDVARWRQRYADGMADIETRLESWLTRPEQVFDLNRNNFLLAYQGEDDRDLQRRYSGFIAKLIGRARPEWRAGRPVTFSGQRRLKVGFYGSIFRDCTAGRYFERWITGLDPSLFERFIYHASPIFDAFTQRIAAGTDRFTVTRAGSLDTATRIFADGLDVLVQPEVGMNAITYDLAAMRLAPVQCVGWGHPVTTGSDAVDAYFTSGPMEPADADAHYVERLVRLPGLGVSYSMPAPQPPIERAQLGLPEGRRLYVCAQSLFKIHPEMDDLFADVIAHDPDGVLVFFQALGKFATENIAARLQRAFARRGIQPRGQLKFLPRMDSGYFRRVLAIADVVLDTVRWSGGNTSIDAFAAGVPVITLPGRFMRGRQTAGMLELMGIPELIASTPADYVAKAVEAASDRDLNASLRRAIEERRGVLFDQQAPVAAFTEALLALGAGRIIQG